MKIKCAKCKEEKDEKFFHRRKLNKNTFYSYCIDCEKLKAKEYQQKRLQRNEFNFI